MANLFLNLPHLLGTITNLDGAESMRALASIKAELSRRQRIFNVYNVNNINKYNKLFKKGTAKEPLPHLFIISDEFAELKKEQPEFMSELVSVARIGRTLGVHLILATQKPTGVVDDQIWSNSKFKLALKVQNESDSKEIIKTADASFITLPGRAYLQVGNNEIYELFQSAWSGAVYTGEEVKTKVDNRIYRINLLGQAELINKDLSDSDESSDSMYSQLDAVVDHIHEVYSTTSHVEVTKPWLPSLQDKIASPYTMLERVEALSTIQKIDLKIALGLVDIPELQTQEDFIIDFVQDGNLATFASSGFGKSTTMGTIITSLAVKNNPQYVNFYLLDFGNSSLIPFKNLPHTADYMNFDSDEKLNKFRTIIQKEIKQRKQIFGEAMAQNFDVYNKLHAGAPLKAIFIMIDNFDVVKEISMDFDEFITKTTRDGAGLGIYAVITATRMNAIRFATLNNFKKKIAQYMFDDGDVMSLVGRSSYKLTEKKGRALVKQKYISMMQVYTAVAFEEDVDYVENLKTLINYMQKQYIGPKVIGIPILPEVFTTVDYKNYAIASAPNDLVGLDLEDVQLVSAEITDGPYVILGPVKCGKTNFLELLMNQDTGKKFLFDSASLDLFNYRHHDTICYIHDEDARNDFMEELLDEITERKQGLEEAFQRGDLQSPKDYYNGLASWTVYIDDADNFIENIGKYPNILNTLNDAVTTGIRIIATASATKLKGYDDLTKFFKNSTYGVLLGNPGTLNMFNLPSMRDIPVFGYGVLFNNGTPRKIKIPKYTGFKEGDL